MIVRYTLVFCVCFLSALTAIAQPPPPGGGGGGGGGGGSVGISGSSTACSYVATTYYATGSPSYYQWLVSGGYITGSSTNSYVVVTFTTAGTREVTLSGYASKSVSVYSVNGGSINGGQTVCYNGAASLGNTT
ncbi:MAG: hypothetical protein RIA63_01230, partial [Cyclobacteriaceae bacterium]